MSVQENKCVGLFGRLFGHKYQPRFDYGASQISTMKGISADEAVELINATRARKYFGDVCTRCGDRLNVEDK